MAKQIQGSLILIQALNDGLTFFVTATFGLFCVGQRDADLVADLWPLVLFQFIL